MELKLPEKTIEKKQSQDEENILDRRKITDEALDQIETEINNITDENTKQSIENIAHILTGDDRFDSKK